MNQASGSQSRAEASASERSASARSAGEGQEGQEAQDGSKEQPQRRTSTIPEAAAELGVSTALLRDLIQQGDVPVLRLGRRVLVRRVTLDRLLAEPEGANAPIVELVQARRDRGSKTRAGNT